MIKIKVVIRAGKYLIAAVLSHFPGGVGDRFFVRYCVHRRWLLSNAVMRKFDSCLKEIGPGDVCIDLGANVGEFTSKLAQTGAEVHAFEPDPTTFNMLKSNMAQFDNVILHNAAVSDQSGKVIFVRSTAFANDPQAALGKSEVAALSQYSDKPSLLAGNEKIEVDCIAIDQFIEQLGKPVSLLKVDVEGAEIEVVSALNSTGSWQNVRALFAETHEWFLRDRVPAFRRLRDMTKSWKGTYVCLDWH